jgi:uncharacterized protein
MLKVDLGRVERRGRVEIDARLPADDPVREAAGLSQADGLWIRLVAQRAGADLLVRGRLSGVAVQQCRRCLREVRSPIDEELVLLFRPGLSAQEAEAAEVYTFPERARELDLTDAVREHAILAVPAFPVCSESCLGLCPRCGADLNQGPCGCDETGGDRRWAALRQHGR